MSDLASCRNCYFYSDVTDQEQKCRRHDFVMPQIGWSTFCRDWSAHEEGDTPFFTSIYQEDMLYYYTYNERSDVLLQAEFAPLSFLQTMVLSVSIREDFELRTAGGINHEWVIDTRRNYTYFPGPQYPFNIMLGDHYYKFEIVSIDRNMTLEMTSQPGGWEQLRHVQPVFVLRSLESPSLLRDWLHSQLDVPRFREQVSRNQPLSVLCFLQILHYQTNYRLALDELTYGPYLLQDA